MWKCVLQTVRGKPIVSKMIFLDWLWRYEDVKIQSQFLNILIGALHGDTVTVYYTTMTACICIRPKVLSWCRWSHLKKMNCLKSAWCWKGNWYMDGMDCTLACEQSCCMTSALILLVNWFLSEQEKTSSHLISIRGIATNMYHFFHYTKLHHWILINWWCRPGGGP